QTCALPISAEHAQRARLGTSGGLERRETAAEVTPHLEQAESLVVAWIGVQGRLTGLQGLGDRGQFGRVGLRRGGKLSHRMISQLVEEGLRDELLQEGGRRRGVAA